MRKYFQITIVIIAFAMLVLIKNARGNSDEQKVAGGTLPTVGPIQTVAPSQPPSPTPTPSSSGATPPASLATPTAMPTPTPKPKGQYKDGTYTGSVEDAVYGNYQVRAVISGGKLADIQPLMYPNDNRTSLSINSQAFPMLRDEALQAQSANVDIISGASDSSPAFARSLASALSQAK